MTTIKNLAVTSAALCMTVMLAVSCGNDQATQDSKEQAEEVNAENLPREGEKDADRMVELSGMNLYEVQASSDAASRATTAEVKKIANMMVEAHSKMATDMQQLAGSKGVALPADLPNDKLGELNRLKEKTGLDYDKEYLDQMKNAHEQVLRKLENTAEKTEDAEVRDFANKSIPEIRSHLDMIESTRNSVKELKSDARQAEGDKNNRSTSGVDDHDGM